MPGRGLTRAGWDAIWADLVELMRLAVAARPDRHGPRRAPAGGDGPAAAGDRHGGEVYVYRRPGEPCHVCGTEISRGELAGRNLYWCRTCQAG